MKKFIAVIITFAFVGALAVNVFATGQISAGIGDSTIIHSEGIGDAFQD
ncbi:MAG: hypothetical protein LBT80_03750 [Lactobacillaceae bacterium]|jgi:hypothetical protein|nr:hypothetical protein [Lactobacillaceae bacterium]